MATFTQRPGGWFAQVRRKGHKSISRTFNTKAEAERWALQIEAGMGVGTYVDNRETLNTTLSECLERYRSEVTPTKKGAHRECQRISKLLDDPISLRAIGTIRSTDMAAWRDAKIASGLSGSSVNRYLALFSHLFTIAIKEWGMPLTNPIAAIRKPKENGARDRRLEGDEEQRILDACDPELRAFIILAIETAMRRGEIESINRSMIRGRVLFLPDTKNGDPRAVPLSTRAISAINSIPARIDGTLFQLTADRYSHKFSEVCRKLGIAGLRLHDLRHEATSRLFEKDLDMMEVATITGHKGLSMLKRYTHLKAEELAKKLG